MAAEIYQYTLKTLNGEELALAQYAGRVLLLVNTASRCGFTPQYAGLEMLYQQFGARGLVVIGCPCNQFGNQEPGDPAEIGEFCRRNYGVTFPLTEKIEVNGPGAHPLFQYLKKSAPGALGSAAIKWNFTKFLLDRTGKPVARYASLTPPSALVGDIEKLL